MLCPYHAIPLYCGSNLLGAWSDCKGCLCFNPFVQRLLSYTDRAAHIFITAVCAAANKSC